MSEILNQATAEIQNWNTVRDNEQSATAIFNNNTSFIITKDAYKQWKSTFDAHESEAQQYIHAYLGVTNPNSNTLLSSFCVDSYTDSLSVVNNQEKYNSNLFQFDYNSEAFTLQQFLKLIQTQQPLKSDNVTPQQAQEAIAAWDSDKDTWVEEQITNQTMVQILVIPFSDLTTLFELPNTLYVVARFGLKKPEDIWQVDLILWSSTPGGIDYDKPEDLIQPVPPYSGFPASDFQLLEYALPPS
ncbi:MAG: hypothetical protein AB8E82_03445 [Aureispira sp.]